MRCDDINEKTGQPNETEILFTECNAMELSSLSQQDSKAPAEIPV